MGFGTDISKEDIRESTALTIMRNLMWYYRKYGKIPCWDITENWRAHPRSAITYTRDGRTSPASRVIHALLIGPVPWNLAVMHLCNNGLCVNPGHLKLGTWSENHQAAYDDGLYLGKNNCNANKFIRSPCGKIFSSSRKAAREYPLTQSCIAKYARFNLHGWSYL